MVQDTLLHISQTVILLMETHLTLQLMRDHIDQSSHIITCRIKYIFFLHPLYAPFLCSVTNNIVYRLFFIVNP